MFFHRIETSSTFILDFGQWMPPARDVSSLWGHRSVLSCLVLHVNGRLGGPGGMRQSSLPPLLLISQSIQSPSGRSSTQPLLTNCRHPPSLLGMGLLWRKGVAPSALLSGLAQLWVPIPLQSGSINPRSPSRLGPGFASKLQLKCIQDDSLR